MEEPKAGVIAMVVLIVEDDPLISLTLENIVADNATGDIIAVRSRADAFATMSSEIDLAILDIDVTNGKTFDVAAELEAMGVPFIFVSASNQSQIPEELRHAPFVPKPFDEASIKRHLADAVSKKARGTATVIS